MSNYRNETRLYLFDIDGTLMITKRAGLRSFVRSVARVTGVDESEIRQLDMSGRLDRGIFHELLRHHRPDLIASGDGILENHWQNFRYGYLEALRQEKVHKENWTIFPGVVETVEFCREHGKVALLTGNIREGAFIKLETMGLDKYFQTGGFGERDIDRGELAAEAFENSKKHFGIEFEPQNTYVIGDTVRDIQAGRYIGAKTLAVATGTQSLEELNAAGPDLATENFTSNPDAMFKFLTGN